jgi:hypothetical protein
MAVVMGKLKCAFKKRFGLSIYIICILLALSACDAKTADEREIEDEPAQKTEDVRPEDGTAAIDSEPTNPAEGDSRTIDVGPNDPETNDDQDEAMPIIGPMPPRYFVTAVETSGIFVRSEANNHDKDNIILRIEAGDESVKLRDTGDTEFKEGFVWRRVELPTGAYGWVREDVVRVDGDPGEFKVKTEYRYWYYDENYDFSEYEMGYILFRPLEINIRFPMVSEDVPDAESINAKIKQAPGKFLDETLPQLRQGKFSFIDKNRISALIINYEVHHFKNLYALFIECAALGPDYGGDVSRNVYYYDAVGQVSIDAKTYAELAGLSEDFILSEAQKRSDLYYYYPNKIEDLAYYIQNDGRLCVVQSVAI